MSFPTGEADVEVIPEASRLNVNTASPEELFRLLIAIGAEPERAREMAMAIVDWRTPVPEGISPFDQYYLSLIPSSRARHASFEEIEELLLVKGMTPELFYGTYVPDAEGRLVPRGGLRDCLSVLGSANSFDINTVEPALMLSIGISPEAVNAIVAQRRVMPFRNPAQLAPLAEAGGPGFQKLRIGGNSVYTFRATARLRLPDGRYSDLRRTVTSTVKYLPTGFNEPFQTLRWDEGARGAPYASGQRSEPVPQSRKVQHIFTVRSCAYVQRARRVRARLRSRVMGSARPRSGARSMGRF
jgi:general secretion pathway protein K